MAGGLVLLWKNVLDLEIARKTSGIFPCNVHEKDFSWCLLYFHNNPYYRDKAIFWKSLEK